MFDIHIKDLSEVKEITTTVKILYDKVNFLIN